PVESDRPPQGRSGAGRGEENVNEGEQEKGPKGQAGPERGAKKAQPHPDERNRSAQGPTLTRISLLSAVVALICGVAGAWGYSHFFGPEKSGDQKSSGKEAGSNTDSGSGSSGQSSSSSSKRSGKDSGTTKNSTDADSKTAKLGEAEAAWLARVKELRQAKDAEKAARASEDEKKAILDFLKNTLLSAGRPGGPSLS